jgi:hypothetical protein
VGGVKFKFQGSKFQGRLEVEPQGIALKAREKVRGVFVSTS